MTVYKRADRPSWEYDFWWRGRRYSGSTRQLKRKDAEDFVRAKRDRLRRQAMGLESGDPIDTPRFTDWAKKVLEYKRRHLKRVDLLTRDLRAMLEFWGARPTRLSRAARAGLAPHHDLRLGDPIADPTWMAGFEDWLARRFQSASARNHARSALSVCYRVALVPMYRTLSHVTSNPCDYLPRERTPRRLAALTPEQIRAWIAHAAPHARLALAIGALAPKLRLANVLALRWDVHFDAELTRLVVPEHKTDRDGLPLVVPLGHQLQRILLAARERAGRSKAVVQFRGRPVKSLKTALKQAAIRAGLPYGLRASQGVTYHTLRHSVATFLAQRGVAEALRQQVMGHAEIATTQIYTHLAAADEQAPLETLGDLLTLETALTAPLPVPRRRRRRTELGTGQDERETKLTRAKSGQSEQRSDRAESGEAP